jgi:CRP-like cAMP-binding protein
MDDRIIRKIIPNLKYKFYKKDELIYKEGDASNSFYFLVKGKVSFKRKVILANEQETRFVEKTVLEEGTHFGDLDIIYDRKKKLSAFCVEDTHIISVDKETFKDLFETRITKVEAEVKSMLKNFLMQYMTLPAIKIERFIQNNIETLFFKRNEVIYREGDNNSYLYMINSGEANLVQKFSRGEYSFLLKYQYSDEYIKNMAKRIDYKGVVKSAYQKIFNIHPNPREYYEYNTINDRSDSNREKRGGNSHRSNAKRDSTETNSESLKLDLILERPNYQVVSNLEKGSLGGLEICTGITKFKYSLITNSDFVSVFKIDLNQLDGEHLTEFMLNLLPSFIKLEKRIRLQVKKMKYIDSNVLPDNCQKFKNKGNSATCFYRDEENDSVYKRNIVKIDNMFQFNEGGFIKMNDFNMKLCRKKHELKELLKENIRKDNKTDLFLRKYVNEQNSKLKFKGFHKINPVIPNYDIVDYKYDNIDNKNNTMESEEIKPSSIYYSIVNGKNCYYLIDKNLLLGKLGNKSKHISRNEYSEKTQEMFDKLFSKPHFPTHSVDNKRALNFNIHKFRNKNFSYKKYFIDCNNYMRDLFVQKKKDTIHCYDKNFLRIKLQNRFAKTSSKLRSGLRRFTLSHDIDKNKKMTFFNTGKYDIPLLTEFDNYYY